MYREMCSQTRLGQASGAEEEALAQCPGLGVELSDDAELSLVHAARALAVEYALGARSAHERGVVAAEVAPEPHAERGAVDAVHVGVAERVATEADDGGGVDDAEGARAQPVRP